METEADNAVREAKATITSLSEGYKAPVPFIRLRGKWLERLGWIAGTRVHVQASTKEIVLSRTDSDIEDACQPAAVCDRAKAGNATSDGQVSQIVVSVHGGLIDAVESFADRSEAIRRAAALWDKADPEADDVKVFGQDGACLWAPPKS